MSWDAPRAIGFDAIAPRCPVIAFVDGTGTAPDAPDAVVEAARSLGRAGLAPRSGAGPSFALTAEVPPRPVLLVPAAPDAAASLRLRSAEAVCALERLGLNEAAVVLPSADEAAVQRVVEGVSSAAHRFASTGHARDPRPAPRIAFAARDPDAGPVCEGLRRGTLTSEAWIVARDLSTEPAGTLTPADMLHRCAILARDSGLRFTALGRAELETLGMGGLLAVAAGSAHEPALARLDWPARGADADAPLLVLVGKTVTFDSGGLSLKKADGMDHMKADMAGGAAVFAAMATVARIAPRFRVTALLPIVENMPDARAMRPSDVIRTAGGRTVEIINTDAEGRLILADALHYAVGLDPAAIIDLATLTGASMGIFGPIGMGVFSTDDGWFEALAAADARSDEKIWRLPLWHDYDRFIASPIADLRNFSTTGHDGGTLIAAAFLRHFVGDRPWLHLDLYNTSWSAEDTPFAPRGPTGSGARLLAQLLVDLDRAGFPPTRPPHASRKD